MQVLRDIQQNPRLLDTLPADQFELLVAELLIDQGWQVSSSTFGDDRHDLLARHECASGIYARWIVECRNESDTISAATPDALHRVSALLPGTVALLVSSGTIGVGAAAFLQDVRSVHVVDRPKLFEWIAAYPRRVMRSATDPQGRFLSCFLSYSNFDGPFTRDLYDRLKRTGVEVWFDEEEMKAGENIFKELERAIAAVDKLLVVLSEQSVASRWVRTELRQAYRRQLVEGRHIIFPVSVVPVETLRGWRDFYNELATDIAEEVRALHITDFTGWRDPKVFDRGFAKLIAALRKELPA